jgi:hypothetical protein
MLPGMRVSIFGNCCRDYENYVLTIDIQTVVVDNVLSVSA